MPHPPPPPTSQSFFRIPVYTRVCDICVRVCVCVRACVTDPDARASDESADEDEEDSIWRDRSLADARKSRPLDLFSER